MELLPKQGLRLFTVAVAKHQKLKETPNLIELARLAESDKTVLYGAVRGKE